jgi:Ni/Fe-hydrogenase 1 B-type cytochrome subunit
MNRTALYERIYVWELPVRVTHWVNVLTILALSFTGLYIGYPFFGGSFYVMTSMRAIHRVSAYSFTASVLLRTYWAFAGNGWASWRALFPELYREGRRGMAETFRYYTFLRRTPPGATGHNPLAGLAYSAVVFLFLVQIFTGFGLLALQKGGWWLAVFGWVFSFGSPQGVRLVHHFVMWLLLGFAVHHVYSAVLIDVDERNAVMTSIVSGYKFERRRT